ncbi:hypothetical protein D3C78_1316210 [compost metagenome]
MRGLFGGRAGVTFVEDLAVVDDQQGIGADAFAGCVVAGWEGVIIQRSGIGDRRADWPFFTRPLFGVNGEADQ